MPKCDTGEINSGLYGFNATLIGVGLTFFFKPTLIVWLAIVTLSALSTLIMRFCLSKKIPVFTFPFILLVWIALFVCHKLGFEAASPAHALITTVDPSFMLMGSGLGYAEVIFQGGLLSGIIFFIAVYVNSPVAALYGLAGSVFSVFIALLLKGGNVEEVKIGMFSFNALLCAIVFSGTKKIDGLYALLAVFISGIVENIMIHQNWAVLTFPFVSATWLTLIIRDVAVKMIVVDTVNTAR